MTVRIDTSRDSLFDELGIKRLKESYMLDTEKSPQERFAFVSESFASNEEHAQRLYEYSSKHWLSYSTPILSFGRNKKGLPISCFLPYLDDTSNGLIETLSEVNWLSMLGGGVGIGVGIRSADEKSTGVMSHLKTYDACSLAYRQGRTRRGSYAAYLDISHPDIIMFLEMRKPTGDPNIRTANLHHGINITDDFMQIIERCMEIPDYDDTWYLRDPHSNEIKDKISAKELWQKILEIRMTTGEPYLHFIDTSNREMQEFQKNLGLKIRQSNLCSEIILPTDKNRTAVCCLSSLNIEYYDEWKNNNLFIKDIAEMLDNVLDYFIKNAPDTISRAKYSAERERSIGIGALGFHSYLQKNLIPFEGLSAKIKNNEIFLHIKTLLNKANEELAITRGSCPDVLEGGGNNKRFSYTMAIAPNASSSIIMGNTSPSVEAMRANAYRQDTISGSFLNKNRYLDREIKKIPELDYQETWSSIIANNGSVQHLNIDNHIKEVFKTAMEIDQRWVIELAADRQKYIDQGQSINLFFRPDSNIKYLHACHYSAWKKGLKTLYYCRSEKIASSDKIHEKIERKILDTSIEDIKNGNECLMCEG